MISPQDLCLLHVTDDVDEAVDLLVSSREQRALEWAAVTAAAEASVTAHAELHDHSGRRRSATPPA
jgi:hypothetical protein